MDRPTGPSARSRPSRGRSGAVGDLGPGLGTSRPATLAGLGTAAIGSLLLVLVVLHLVQAGLSPADHVVSEYALGPFGALFTVGYVLAGVGTLALAWAMRLGVGRTRGIAPALGSLVVIAIGLVGTGLTRIDPAGALTSPTTTSGQLHELAGYVTALGLVAGVFVVPATFAGSPTFGRVPSTLRRFRWAVLAGLAGLLTSRILGVPIGLSQRVFLVVALSWLLLVGTYLLSLGSSPARAVVRRMDEVADGHRPPPA